MRLSFIKILKIRTIYAKQKILKNWKLGIGNLTHWLRARAAPLRECRVTFQHLHAVLQQPVAPFQRMQCPLLAYTGNRHAQIQTHTKKKKKSLGNNVGVRRRENSGLGFQVLSPQSPSSAFDHWHTIFEPGSITSCSLAKGPGTPTPIHSTI